ncbi:uncharacterized protein MELLADRAFT_70245 [Melampsora larici-populina 98AG31]|uniref:Uncharacterized protein n=1 Tax=Melampsora larici-populina (strain 98AG31 / pathotype 3-4-7) TaxID=747676 RepID=F4S3S5_MELLP|nr:uncharacterized protein MELLADRAFT_67610 [Melampsora larici-populina 98AG31]XP_007419670.1 uncharacterized protein MELLADRAFT_70245 [Melampsora larici-populina 98AG31]EGF97059.1 hypothetical protein MELLADRAFT_70245 [Melampsora larici-populina 98AG31]EGG00746.1 hypothetical protein MELLADRAFT_67610 [Melampsora larici-populina 98AG31]
MLDACTSDHDNHPFDSNNALEATLTSESEDLQSTADSVDCVVSVLKSTSFPVATVGGIPRKISPRAIEICPNLFRYSKGYDPIDSLCFVPGLILGPNEDRITPSLKIRME